jgi:hypothetical protein
MHSLKIGDRVEATYYEYPFGLVTECGIIIGIKDESIEVKLDIIDTPQWFYWKQVVGLIENLVAKSEKDLKIVPLLDLSYDFAKLKDRQFVAISIDPETGDYQHHYNMLCNTEMVFMCHWMIHRIMIGDY